MRIIETSPYTCYIPPHAIALSAVLHPKFPSLDAVLTSLIILVITSEPGSVEVIANGEVRVVAGYQGPNSMVVRLSVRGTPSTVSKTITSEGGGRTTNPTQYPYVDQR
jgi:hypothetical protein